MSKKDLKNWPTVAATGGRGDDAPHPPPTNMNIDKGFDFFPFILSNPFCEL